MMDKDTPCGEAAVGAIMAEEAGVAEEAEEVAVEEDEVAEEEVAVGEDAVVVLNEGWLHYRKMNRQLVGLQGLDLDLSITSRTPKFPLISHYKTV